jgi:outer membrane lipoprotein-sorting protein
MRFGRVPIVRLALCLLSAGLSSCISHHIAIARKGGSTTKQLLVADQAALIATVTRQYNAVRDFSATVDMAALVGSSEKNQISEYKDIRAYMYFRRPSDLHLLGLYPVIRTTAFDMVSSGTEFKLYVPKDNSFTMGRNDGESPSNNKIEDLRPQHFLEAIRVRPIDTAVDKVFTENLTDEEYFYYILHLVREENGHLVLTRTIWFNRQDLTMARQMIFDGAGNIVSDDRYSDWHPFDNVPFPKHVEIHRPREGYGATIDIVKMDINKGVSDDKFVLTQPEGTVLKVIGPKTKEPTP